MATVNLGRIKFVWQGAYSGATAYVADDVVSYNGSSYICILASTGNLPTNTTYWNLMAQTGTDITSLAGLAQGDVLYYNGTSWVRLGAGTSGQYLKTNGASANPSWANGSASTLTTQGDILYRDASGLQRLGAGTSGQFLKTNGSGANPAWSTVTTKIVNVAHTSINQATNAGNRYRNPYHWSPLDTSISVTNSSNYFLWQVSVPITHNNHAGAAIEASENNSTWVNASNKKNLSGDAIVQSGGGITWDTSYLGRYPHLVFDNNLDDVNRNDTGKASGLYRPTGTPSILYFRFRIWSENATVNLLLGGDTDTGNTVHGSAGMSSFTVWEIAP